MWQRQRDLVSHIPMDRRMCCQKNDDSLTRNVGTDVSCPCEDQPLLVNCVWKIEPSRLGFDCHRRFHYRRWPPAIRWGTSYLSTAKSHKLTKKLTMAQRWQRSFQNQGRRLSLSLSLSLSLLFSDAKRVFHDPRLGKDLAGARLIRDVADRHPSHPSVTVRSMDHRCGSHRHFLREIMRLAFDQIDQWWISVFSLIFGYLRTCLIFHTIYDAPSTECTWPNLARKFRDREGGLWIIHWRGKRRRVLCVTRMMSDIENGKGGTRQRPKKRGQNILGWQGVWTGKGQNKIKTFGWFLVENIVCGVFRCRCFCQLSAVTRFNGIARLLDNQTPDFYIWRLRCGLFYKWRLRKWRPWLQIDHNHLNHQPQSGWESSWEQNCNQNVFFLCLWHSTFFLLPMLICDLKHPFDPALILSSRSDLWPYLTCNVCKETPHHIQYLYLAFSQYDNIVDPMEPLSL